MLKDSQGFIKVVSSKRKKKNNSASVQNYASIPGSQFKPDQPTHCNPATERNKKANCKPSKPSQAHKPDNSSLVSKQSETKSVNKQSKPKQVSKPAGKSSEQTSKGNVIEKDNITRTDNQKNEDNNKIMSMVFSNSNLNVNSEREFENKIVNQPGFNKRKKAGKKRFFFLCKHPLATMGNLHEISPKSKLHKVN